MAHASVGEVFELDPESAETAAVQKRIRVLASCCVAHMACGGAGDEPKPTTAGRVTVPRVV